MFANKTEDITSETLSHISTLDHIIDPNKLFSLHYRDRRWKYYISLLVSTPTHSQINEMLLPAFPVLSQFPSKTHMPGLVKL